MNPQPSTLNPMIRGRGPGSVTAVERFGGGAKAPCAMEYAAAHLACTHLSRKARDVMEARDGGRNASHEGDDRGAREHGSRVHVKHHVPAHQASRERSHSHVRLSTGSPMTDPSHVRHVTRHASRSRHLLTVTPAFFSFSAPSSFLAEKKSCIARDRHRPAPPATALPVAA